MSAPMPGPLKSDLSRVSCRVTKSNRSLPLLANTQLPWRPSEPLGCPKRKSGRRLGSCCPTGDCAAPTRGAIASSSARNITRERPRCGTFIWSLEKNSKACTSRVIEICWDFQCSWAASWVGHGPHQVTTPVEGVTLFKPMAGTLRLSCSKSEDGSSREDPQPGGW